MIAGARRVLRERVSEVRVWLTLLTLGLIAFGLLAAAAMRVPPYPIDPSVTTWLHAHASPWSDALMRAITSLGSTSFLAVVAGVVALASVMRRKGATAVLLLAALVGSLALNEFLKALFTRPRPALGWAEPISGFSFPSGHAMNSLVVYVVVGLVALRWWGTRSGLAALSLALMLAGLVGISRVYLGYHWASDVAGGAVAGAVYVLILMPFWSAAGR